MLKVTKVQPIAAHRDYTRKDRGNFQEIYCKAQKKYAQAGDYRAAEKTVKITMAAWRNYMRTLLCSWGT